jgi:hypothetical protein
MLFFAHFHVFSTPVPNFAPDFEGPNSGQYGVREWYQYHVFYPTRGMLVKEMTYESEWKTFGLPFTFVLIFNFKTIVSVSATSIRPWASHSQR